MLHWKKSRYRFLLDVKNERFMPSLNVLLNILNYSARIKMLVWIENDLIQFTIVRLSPNVLNGLIYVQGAPGPHGSKGDQGAIGLKGEQGRSGSQGLPGEQGPQGLIGLTGQKGIYILQ